MTFGALLRAIDWRLLLLFAGLFVVIGAIEQAGIDRRLFLMLQPLAHRNERRPQRDGRRPVKHDQQRARGDAVHARRTEVDDPRRAWLALAMASTLAGNLTISDRLRI